MNAPAGKPRSSSPRRRRIKAETWHVVIGHLQREREKLPADSPRVRPTLPALRFLEREEAAE